jgi:hypothetical protein
MATEEGQEDVFFRDKKAMTISEVAIALDQCTSERKLRDPSYQPNLLVTKTLEYTNTVSTNKNPDTVRKIRRYLLFYTVLKTSTALSLSISVCV